MYFDDLACIFRSFLVLQFPNTSYNNHDKSGHFNGEYFGIEVVVKIDKNVGHCV